MPQGMLTAFYSRDLICVSYEKVQPDGKGKKKKKRGGGKERNGNATCNRNTFFPQHLLYEAGAGECGKERFFRNFPMGRKRSVSFGNACTFTH